MHFNLFPRSRYISLNNVSTQVTFGQNNVKLLVNKTTQKQIFSSRWETVVIGRLVKYYLVKLSANTRKP